MPTLEQHWDRENIPSFLGGGCECAHVEGGCINSNIGPWNDFEIHGTGIRPKQAHHDEEEAKTEEVKTEEVDEAHHGEEEAKKEEVKTEEVAEAHEGPVSAQAAAAEQ